MDKNPRHSRRERILKAFMPALMPVLAAVLLAQAQPVAAQTLAQDPKNCAPEGDLHFV
jgi:hypothetical protein